MKFWIQTIIHPNGQSVVNQAYTHRDRRSILKYIAYTVSDHLIDEGDDWVLVKRLGDMDHTYILFREVELSKDLPNEVSMRIFENG